MTAYITKDAVLGIAAKLDAANGRNAPLAHALCNAAIAYYIEQSVSELTGEAYKIPEQRTAGCTLCGHCAATGEKIQAAQPAREPLSDEGIAEIVEYLPENSDEQIQDDPAKFIRDLIRAVEREHGIGGDK